MNTNEISKIVLGLGKTGLSCVHYLSSQNSTCAVMDSRLNPPGLDELKSCYPDIPYYLGAWHEDVLNLADEIIVSPGVSVKEAAIAKQVKRGIPVYGDIELFARVADAPVIAITGSNGKSTVTTLISHLLNYAGYKVKTGGNIGIPALNLLGPDTPDFYVLELSSFQLETTYSLKTLTAVNLNISDDHMDRYASLDEYIQAKLRIYQDCQRPIINLDDPNSYQNFHFTAAPTGFRLGEPLDREFGVCEHNSQLYLTYGKQHLLPASQLPLKGKHQIANVLAALALGLQAGLNLEVMIKALPSFKGLPHRCEWIAKINGVDWYNDSKATNVGAAQAAIMGIGPQIEGKIVLLAGGQGKNADFSPLYAPIQNYVRTVILYGEDKHKLAEALQGASNIIQSSSLDDAVRLAHSTAKKGDVVMLSPACASYDMFRNFEHRGEVFAELVKGIKSDDNSQTS